jgi:uncharacterized 2Fe-2S/4Fe-4S cluster protein (DUF4445 family)
MKHFRVVFRPDDKEISIHQGATLLDAAGRAGIILTTSCGGKGTCHKCALRLYPSEQQILACQYRVESDLVVMVPPESRFYEHKILLHGVTPSEQVRPTVFHKYRPRAGAGGIGGLAVDIGTTTVVAKLVDMTDGRCLATQAVLNPQTRFGDDVVSRINYGQTPEHLAELHEVIIECINRLIRQLCHQAGLDASRIYEACIVGNTTMNHIFLRLPVEQLGRAPYRAWSVDAHDFPPGQLQIEINPAGNVHCVENIAGFVGADTVAGALAVDMDRIEDRVLLVDIGTNGELVLGTRDQLYAASCAAGPALEGARIRHGSRAADGAIEAVVFNDDVAVDVIGDAPPRSVCGSGLIDAVAVLLDLGVVEATGRFADRENIGRTLPPAIASRLCEHEGQPAFYLTRGRNPSQSAVLLTQRDVREVQLAKGAIRAGIRILLGRSDMSDLDLDRVLLAGAFGNYIRPASAVRIGLLPGVPLDRIRSIGNAAASGAQMLLISDECRERAARLARRIQYVEIAHEKDFADVFADAMFLNP